MFERYSPSLHGRTSNAARRRGALQQVGRRRRQVVHVIAMGAGALAQAVPDRSGSPASRWSGLGGLLEGGSALNYRALHLTRNLGFD